MTLKVLEFLVGIDYHVFVKQTGKDSFYVGIPRTTRNPELQIEYTVERKKDDCTLVKESNALSKRREIKAPGYGLRPLIVADLRRMCRAIRYDPELIVFYDENNLMLGYGSIGFLTHDIVRRPRLKTAQDKEINLLALLEQTELHGDLVELRQMAAELGIKDGYEAILKRMDAK
jgi:hypothetical protein